MAILKQRFSQPLQEPTYRAAVLGTSLVNTLVLRKAQ
jgi:hypothetical protein